MLGEQPVLRGDHVVVRVLREFRMQPIAGLTRSAVPNAVGQHDEILRAVEQLAGCEEFAGIRGGKKAAPRPAGAVQNHDRVANDASGIALRCAERGVVESQLGESFTRAKGEILDDEVARGTGASPTGSRRRRLGVTDRRRYGRARKRERAEQETKKGCT